MRDFNEVRLLGNVANELKHRKTPWNTSEYHCRLAIHNTWKDYKTGQTNKKTDFINIKILPGNSPVSAAILEKIKVGSKLFVSGKIKQRDYDGKNGEKLIWTEVETKEFELMASHDSELYESKTEGSQTKLPSLKASTGIQPSIKDVLDTNKSSDEIADQVVGYMSNQLPTAPEGGAGDLDDEIPF